MSNQEAFSPTVRTDAASTARKMQIIGRMIKDYELLSRNTILADDDARDVLLLRKILGDLVEKNHERGYRAAKDLLAKLASVPGKGPRK